MKSKHSNIVNLSILALITTFFWLTFSVYRIVTKKPPEVVPPEVISPIDPNLDTKAMNELKTRYYIDEANIPDSTFIPTTTPTATAVTTQSPSPTATSTATASPTPTPTPQL